MKAKRKLIEKADMFLKNQDRQFESMLNSKRKAEEERDVPLKEMVKTKEVQMREETERQDYENKFEVGLLKSKNQVRGNDTFMVTEETEKMKVKQPHLRKKIDHKRVSSIGADSQLSSKYAQEVRIPALVGNSYQQ